MARTTKKQTVTLIDNATGKTAEFPLMKGRLGPKVIDIRRLYEETGYFTYDPGYTATGSTESAITYIDGDKGILLHRGYAIEELAEKSDFMEVCYLLLNGELPNRAQKRKFEQDITMHTMVHEQLNNFFPGLSPGCPSHGDHVRRRRRAIGLLSRFNGYR